MYLASQTLFVAASSFFRRGWRETHAHMCPVERARGYLSFSRAETDTTAGALGQ